MNNSNLSIEKLMSQGVAGDSDAYNAVLKEIRQILRPYLLKRLKGKAEIDDVLQEILISVHKARKSYDGRRPFKPWLFAIARYRLHDHLRKCYADKLRYALDLSEVDKILPIHTETPLTLESIHSEIDELSGRQPQILRLMHNEGYTAKEVASSLDMRESAVRVAAHRAYKILRKKLAG